ncbi:MAG: hypothetical protein MRJ93_06045 [Nitrososphaeraceae archaeon]|nr:hypothetical protein [Nitrososphaeraceae archaeon]
MRINMVLIVVITIITIFIGSNIVQFLQTFAQPTNINTKNNQANTTAIDTAIINMLDKVSRGNIIDSTMNSIVSGMNAAPNQDQIQNNQQEPKSLRDINSIIASNTGSFNVNNPQSNTQPTAQSKQDVPNNDIVKFILKVVNKDNNDETILKSNSLTEFNNELIKFCTTSQNILAFECISSMQNSIQAVDFTSNYMGPSKLITNLDNFKLDLTVR